MAYTVHEVARLSGVSIKTLYHYQKVGLLPPQSVAANGYRLYGEEELERLQQILFYRELEFPLAKIKEAMENEPSRLRCLREQKLLLKARQQRTGHVLHTLEEAIECAEKGVTMKKETMFTGLNRQEWESALAPQNEYLQQNYGVALATGNIDADALNDKAREAAGFMQFMAQSLKNGVGVADQSVCAAIEKHIQFLHKDGPLDAQGFAAQTKFLMGDDFHRQMMESQQTGLSYYLCCAAESYAAE